MATRDTIVTGASAGGVQALSKLVSDLNPDLPAAVFTVLHIPTKVPSYCRTYFQREARLPVAHAVDCEEIKRGRAGPQTGDD